MNPAICPECGNSTLSDLCGHEDPMVYDGVLAWQCMKCQFVWPRWTVEDHPRRGDMARRYADKRNQNRKNLTLNDIAGGVPSVSQDSGRRL